MENFQQNFTLEIYAKDTYVKKIKVPFMSRLLDLRALLKFDNIIYYFEDRQGKIIEVKDQESTTLVQDITKDHFSMDKKQVVVIRTVPVSIPITFKTKKQYVSTFSKLLDNEVAFEKHKERIFKSAKFALDPSEQRKITKRIFIYTSHSVNFQEKQVLQLRLPYKDEMKPAYEGFGIIFKVHFLQDKNVKVLVDINIKHPFSKNHQTTQDLPVSDPMLYTGDIQFAIVEEGVHYDKMLKVLEQFEKEQDKSVEVIKQILTSGKFQKSEQKKGKQIPTQFFVEGLPKDFSSSQIQAVRKAFEQRLTLIQGPPGTGKTLTVSALVANLVKIDQQQKIMVCAPSNAAADLIAERLQQIPMLQNKFLRFFSEKKEDYFNIDPKTIKSFTLQARILFQSEEDQQFHNEMFLSTKFTDNQIAIKRQIEYYFSDYNYNEKEQYNQSLGRDEKGDEYLKSLADNDGWIEIDKILTFYRLSNLGATNYDLVQLAKYALEWEISKNMLNIRKKDRSVNSQLTLLGFDIEQGIRHFDKTTYDEFMAFKRKVENGIINATPIIITTLNSAVGSRLSKFRFRKVIIDEAAQAQELECLQTILNANQVILIGDHKQIGPLYQSEINGPDSMFTRLVEAGYPFTMLDKQYRMHQYLLRVPNLLFYNGEIQNGYRFHLENTFIHRDYPLLFIETDHRKQKEERYGTSFVNKGEVQIIKSLLLFLRDKKIYDVGKIGIVSPYAGQVQILRDSLLHEFGLDFQKNIRSVDGWQGRDQEVIIFSSVRSNRKTIGFLNNARRTNVALTRAMHGMIMIGNRETLSTDEKWKELIRQLDEDQTIVEGVDHAIRRITELHPIKYKEIIQSKNPQDEEEQKSNNDKKNQVKKQVEQILEDQFTF